MRGRELSMGPVVSSQVGIGCAEKENAAGRDEGDTPHVGRRDGCNGKASNSVTEICSSCCRCRGLTMLLSISRENQIDDWNFRALGLHQCCTERHASVFKHFGYLGYCRTAVTTGMCASTRLHHIERPVNSPL